jgi:hypothetical protein
MIQLGRYTDTEREDWDRFVRASRNATFLFVRNYMDYHRDRFEDHSVLARDSQGDIVALLPANCSDRAMVSHGGLTYGGWLIDHRMKAPLMVELFGALVEFLRLRGFNTLVYKCILSIYHRQPAEEDQYALFRLGATLRRRDVSSCLKPSCPVPIQERRSRGAAKARKAGVRCSASDDWKGFWKVLEWNLSTIHGRQPVHTLQEIHLLQSRFPKEIRLFVATQDSRVIAGTVIYETDCVAHAQYTANSEEGREVGALDLLFRFLIEEVYSSKPYVDLGISTENQGQTLNEGLVDFKEGMGARTVVYDHYEIGIR